MRIRARQHDRWQSITAWTAYMSLLVLLIQKWQGASVFCGCAESQCETFWLVIAGLATWGFLMHAALALKTMIEDYIPSFLHKSLIHLTFLWFVGLGVWGTMSLIHIYKTGIQL